MELPYCNGDNFQFFLNELSQKNPKEFKIVLLDNGAFHKGKKLQIPENIFLLFLPPYSPELNPAELVWLNIKRKTTNVIYKTLEDLKNAINNISKVMITEEFILSLCRFDYFFN